LALAFVGKLAHIVKICTRSRFSEHCFRWRTGLRKAFSVTDDMRKTKSQLVVELADLRQHVAKLAAADGEEALATLAAHPSEVDLVISDLVMPRMGGLELMSRVRSEYTQVKVIVISAFDQIIDPAAREQDVVTTLRKPFELTEVADALQMALGER